MEHERMERLGDDTGAELPAAGSGGDAEPSLTPLHPNQVKVLRANALLTSVPLIVAALVLESAAFAFPGLALVPITIASAVLVLVMPRRRYRAAGYELGADRLRVVKGVLFRSDTIVPFGRVQHLDVAQGPVERYYGIATLTLHTAGTHNASVSLPGLGHETALAMRESIRAHVRRETL
jgi:membrane protein YdbS with pleckstrin-like domain